MSSQSRLDVYVPNRVLTAFTNRDADGISAPPRVGRLLVAQFGRLRSCKRECSLCPAFEGRASAPIPPERMNVIDRALPYDFQRFARMRITHLEHRGEEAVPRSMGRLADHN